MTDDRPLKEYQARVVQNVVAIPSLREIAIWFVGEASVEDSDLGVRLPIGAAAAMATQLHGACAEMDKSVADEAVVMQPLVLAGAEPAMRLAGNPALVLYLNGFHLSVMLSSNEAARQIIDALERAVAMESGSISARKLS